MHLPEHGVSGAVYTVEVRIQDKQLLWSCKANLNSPAIGNDLEMLAHPVRGPVPSYVTYFSTMAVEDLSILLHRTDTPSTCGVESWNLRAGAHPVVHSSSECYIIGLVFYAIFFIVV
jgi:hypothetical protein